MIHRVLETEYAAVSVYDLVRHAAVDGVDGLTWEDGNAIRVVAGLVDELVRFPAFLCDLFFRCRSSCQLNHLKVLCFAVSMRMCSARRYLRMQVANTETATMIPKAKAMRTPSMSIAKGFTRTYAAAMSRAPIAAPRKKAWRARDESILPPTCHAGTSSHRQRTERYAKRGDIAKRATADTSSGIRSTFFAFLDETVDQQCKESCAKSP